MSNNLESKQKEDLLEKQDSRHHEIYNQLDYILRTLKEMDSYNHRSSVFKNFEIAVRLLQDKLHEDVYKSVKIIERSKQSQEMKQLQKALNRERKLRQELENKINEATTSSGLFIKYVRDKLGV